MGLRDELQRGVGEDRRQLQAPAHRPSKVHQAQLFKTNLSYEVHAHSLSCQRAPLRSACAPQLDLSPRRVADSGAAAHGSDAAQPGWSIAAGAADRNQSRDWQHHASLPGGCHPVPAECGCVEIANHAMFPLELALVVPFIRLGSRVFHTAAMPLGHDCSSRKRAGTAAADAASVDVGLARVCAVGGDCCGCRAAAGDGNHSAVGAGARSRAAAPVPNRSDALVVLS